MIVVEDDVGLWAGPWRALSQEPRALEQGGAGEKGVEKNFHCVSEDLNTRFQRYSYQGCFLMARQEREQVDGGER